MDRLSAARPARSTSVSFSATSTRASVDRALFRGPDRRGGRHRDVAPGRTLRPRSAPTSRCPGSRSTPTASRPSCAGRRSAKPARHPARPRRAARHDRPGRRSPPPGPAAGSGRCWCAGALALGVAAVYLLAARIAFGAGLILPVVYPLARAVRERWSAWLRCELTTTRDRARPRARAVRPLRARARSWTRSLSAADDDLCLGGVRVQSTVVFCDLRGFTAFAELAPADQVIDIAEPLPVRDERRDPRARGNAGRLSGRRHLRRLRRAARAGRPRRPRARRGPRHGRAAARRAQRVAAPSAASSTASGSASASTAAW